MESDSIAILGLIPEVIPQTFYRQARYPTPAFVMHMTKIIELPGRSVLVTRLEGSSPRQGIYPNTHKIIFLILTGEVVEYVACGELGQHGGAGSSLANTPCRGGSVHMPRDHSVPASRSRVHKHTVKRQLEITLTLPQIQQHGFSHPQNGYWVMLPREFDVVLALESKAVVQVILEVLRQTIGYPGDGPQERRIWVEFSYSHFARKGLMSRGAAQ